MGRRRGRREAAAGHTADHANPRYFVIQSIIFQLNIIQLSRGRARKGSHIFPELGPL